MTRLLQRHRQRTSGNFILTRSSIFVGLILLPVHNLQFCRFRRSLRVPPTQPLDQRRVINPAGERSWVEVAWSGKGHRTPVNTVLGSIARFHYPGVVQLNGAEIGAYHWAHWGLKPYGPDRTHQDAVWSSFWVSLLCLLNLLTVGVYK